ncbi:hypothetical protein QBC38DRAFT_449752 [Podospora fimiseda]|uniref:Uncharacterized protein n=1 Tax=Podospora fimiseda TaxID=252190 RepID=A0AAN6YQZ2_9PEZI|nr:hypothetical protein QBC38DRAFT_449752 [Podospora fimiseda]
MWGCLPTLSLSLIPHPSSFTINQTKTKPSELVWSGSDIDAIQLGAIMRVERALVAFKSRSSEILYNIVPIWSDTRVLTNLNICVGEWKGSQNGKLFDLLAEKGIKNTLKSIKIRWGSRVDAIACGYIPKNGKSIDWTDSKGGTGAGEQ